MPANQDPQAVHGEMLAEAVRLSREMMRANKGGPFGAVVACDGRIVARGYNRVTSTLDPTAHAEVTAIREACAALGRFDLSGCVLYSSCEPCPMCLAAAYWARLDAVYYANTQNDAAAIGFDDRFLYDELKLDADKRSLPLVHLPSAEALDVFDEWREKPDKILY